MIVPALSIQQDLALANSTPMPLIDLNDWADDCIISRSLH